MAGPASVSTLLLRNVPLFSVLPDSQLTLLTGVVARKSFSRGTTIIAVGDTTESLYIVISGRMKVMMSDDEGREVILAVERSDFPVIKAITVYVAAATMLFNLLADLMYQAVDPRVQLK